MSDLDSFLMDQLNDQDALITELLEALRPLAALEVPAKPDGNAGAYSIRHSDILAAVAAIDKAKACGIAAPKSASGTVGVTDAASLAYGLLWHMQIDREDDNLRLASDARKALLSVMSKDDQLRGIDAAKATEGRFTGAA
jgi:hypothetical protein